MTDRLTLGFDAKRAFANVTGLGSYSRFVLRALRSRYPEHRYLLYTPHRARRVDLAVDESDVRTAPRFAALLFGGALWRTFAMGRQAARDGVQLFHGLSQELPRDLPPHGMRSIVTQHDLVYVRYPELYPRLDRALYTWKYRWSCERADRIVAVSEQTKRDLCEFYGIAPDRIRVVYQGCDPRFGQRLPSQDVAAVRSRYALPDEYILTVGTIERRKNALVLLRALTHMSPAERPVLALVGRSTHYRRVLDDFTRRHALDRWIRVLHPVPPGDLPALYQGASVFLYPSRFEGFGIPILEALRSEVPVVTSTGSCFAEAGGAAARYVSPDDAAAIADAIRTIRSDRALAHAMVAEGRRHAARFDDDVLAEQLMTVYTETLCAT